MNTREMRFNNELEKRVDEVLYYVWDPIGVSNEPLTWGEYRSYAQKVFQLLTATGSEEDIAKEIVKYLADVSFNWMGIDPVGRHDRKVADLLLRHGVALAEHGSGVSTKQHEIRFKSELEQRIDEVLYYVWDPLGVKDEPLARDEYSSYVDDVVRLLLGDGSREGIAGQIAEYLASVESVLLEVGTGHVSKHESEVAELLLQHRDAVEMRYGDQKP